MIPFFHPPNIPLGPLTLEPFGILAALGIYLGARLTAGRAVRMGLDPTPVLDWALWGVASGVVVGHFVHLFLYHPEELRDPWRIFKVWDGLSSFGGLLGGIIAAIVFFRLKGISFDRYADAFAVGSAPGWAVARLGCFSVHDHKGTLTDFFLAVKFPAGARHDLGLYDALALFAISLVLWTLASRRLLTGRLLPLFAVLYSVSRFFLDFLRASDLPYVDKRYAGLTPAQYFCFLLVAWGVWRFATSKPLAPEVAVRRARR